MTSSLLKQSRHFRHNKTPQRRQDALLFAKDIVPPCQLIIAMNCMQIFRRICRYTLPNFMWFQIGSWTERRESFMERVWMVEDTRLTSLSAKQNVGGRGVKHNANGLEMCSLEWQDLPIWLWWMSLGMTVARWTALVWPKSRVLTSTRQKTFGVN